MRGYLQSGRECTPNQNLSRLERSRSLSEPIAPLFVGQHADSTVLAPPRPHNSLHRLEARRAVRHVEVLEVVVHEGMLRRLGIGCHEATQGYLPAERCSPVDGLFLPAESCG